MNNKQRAVLTIGLIVVALMLIVPPWKRNAAHGGDHAGYGLLFSPAPRFNPTSNSLESSVNYIHLDIAVLFAQILLVAVLCSIAYLFTRKA